MISGTSIVLKRVPPREHPRLVENLSDFSISREDLNNLDFESWAAFKSVVTNGALDSIYEVVPIPDVFMFEDDSDLMPIPLCRIGLEFQVGRSA